ncbi:ABC transporter substrate-binding protein [Xylophilus sp.]|uniref:ABC transporter substrate-binding protein n=1 Tax=Xylophilus sp. TaxID=2653893 RepID=UPI0013BC1495|nr:ABC transporter substrate-binding protein [Xylophilus sp.]KAF1043341.1 MAG: Leu/Ile/Val-binding protein [Xylophilus sp.]
MTPFRSLSRLLTAATAAAMLAGTAHAATLVIAQVAPLSGLEASMGRSYAAGLQIAVNQVNKAGGINGNTFALVRKDDAGRPDETLPATRALLSESRPVVLAGYLGNQGLDSVLGSGLLEKEHIALVGYRTTEIRAEAPLLFNVRAGLREEIGKIADHLATVGISRVGLLYEESPAAAELRAAAEEAGRRTHITIVAQASYPQGTAKVMPAVEVLSTATPQAIILAASGSAAAAFIEQYRGLNGAAQLFATSGVDVEQLVKRLGDEHLRGVAIAQVTPSPYKITGRLAREFSEAAAATPPDVPLSFALMEGYIAGRVVFEAVRRAGARGATREGVAAALEAMDSYDLGGYQIGYRPNNRAGSRYVELSIVTGTGRLRQ